MLHVHNFKVLNYLELQFIPYGSVTRGTDTIYSDFDVLVVCPKCLFDSGIDSIHNYFTKHALKKFVQTQYKIKKSTESIDLIPVLYDGEITINDKSYPKYKMYDENLQTVVNICPEYTNCKLNSIYGIYGNNILNFIRDKKVLAHLHGIQRPSIYIEIEAIKSYLDLDNLDLNNFICFKI